MPSGSGGYCLRSALGALVLEWRWTMCACRGYEHEQTLVIQSSKKTLGIHTGPEPNSNCAHCATGGMTELDWLIHPLEGGNHPAITADRRCLARKRLFTQLDRLSPKLTYAIYSEHLQPEPQCSGGGA